MSIELRTKQAIVNGLALKKSLDDISDKTKIFYEGLGLDSVAAMEVVIAVENEFDIFIEDEELNADIFATIGTLVEFVTKKLNNGQ